MVLERFDLSGRTALVTGGGRGIGRHIAIGLAEAGADVFVASRKLENCEAVAAEIRQLGRRGEALRVDLEDESDVRSLADRVLASCDRLHVLVNDAGAIWGAPTLEFPLEGWDKVFRVNVRGLWILSQRVAVHMEEMGGGSIIHVNSISAFRGYPEAQMPTIAYNASKGAVAALTRDMAVKLGSHGIRVNEIAPGSFLTDMMNHIRHDEALLREHSASIPLRRCGEGDDVKGVAVYLASEASSYVTGHTLVLDGGVMAT